MSKATSSRSKRAKPSPKELSVEDFVKDPSLDALVKELKISMSLAAGVSWNKFQKKVSQYLDEAILEAGRKNYELRSCGEGKVEIHLRGGLALGYLASMRGEPNVS